MLEFICPHCNQSLRVRPEHLGLRGHCRKCNGRIALIGVPGSNTQYHACVVEDTVPEPQVPATERQLAALRKLGAGPKVLNGLSREQASALLRARHAQPPTEKQMAYLRRLGASGDQIASLVDSSEASALIEEMHLQPTQPQMALLRKLGAPGERIARLKSRGEASALIDALKGRD